MNVDRYITDEAVEVAFHIWETEDGIAEILRAALPGILAQHRADVLRQVRGDTRLCSCAREVLRERADEAVASD